MAEVDVVITVERDGADMDSVTRALEAVGLRGAEYRKRFGIVNGTLPEGKMDAARGVPGVTAVRTGRTYGTRD